MARKMKSQSSGVTNKAGGVNQHPRVFRRERYSGESIQVKTDLLWS
jgi:hypothetical protein